ncbi:hypothetical protein CRG98_002949 [Punica granatum]|uniref:Uncharacterized protein n=1 Tax=Punica granatum TaxID=22663 RepID=A0A2I0L7M7_PUNGR|nr:hypothetical protein CRG98_002949 [Punica granatum]
MCLANAHSSLNSLFTFILMHSQTDSWQERGIRTVLKTPYWFCRACSTCLSTWDSAPRTFPKTAAHAKPQLGKVHLCGSQSRSDHSRVGHTGHKQRAMRGFTLPRELCRALHLLLQQGKGPTVSDFSSVHPPRGTHCKVQQETIGDIAPDACHGPI